ncbi:MAG: hypothetical protein WC205_09070 [Opitutaceae bacterium]|jgi:autotransporter-associated beta strand protein
MKLSLGFPLLAVTILLGGLPQRTFATTYTYTANATGSWSTATNWNSGNGPAPASDLDAILSFTTSQNTVATNDLGTVQLNRLSAANSNKSLTIAGSSVNNLNFVKNSSDVSPTLQLTKNSSSGLTISIPITVTDALTITNSGTNAGVTTISGAITNSGGMTFDGSGASPITLSGVVSGAGGIAHGGSYTVTLSKANTYTGVTTVSGGTLALGIAHAVSSSSNVVLSGGLLQSDFGQTLGMLDLSASSTLDLSSGGTFVFADSSALAGSWTGTLSIIGTFTDGASVNFGIGGLTNGQLGQITINGSAAALDGSGYLVVASIPEPSVYSILAGMLTMVGVICRRRRLRA